MITVQYLPSSHIQIKVVCTVRSVNLVTFVTLAAGMATFPHILRAVLPKTRGGGFEGPAHQPCSWGSFEGGRVCLQDLGSCHFHFSKDGLSTSSRNELPAQAKLGVH